MGIVILSLAAIIISIVLGNRFKINMGLIAVCFAIVIGVVFLDMKTVEIFDLMPDKILFSIVAITIFYGFFLENGTLSTGINHLIYRFRKRNSFLMIMLFLTTIALSSIGVGAVSATAIMAPIAMSLALLLHQPFILVVAAVSYGACTGGNFILSQGGIVASALVNESIYAGQSLKMVLPAFFHSFIIFSLLFLTIYFIYNRFKGNVSDTVSTPEPFNRIQRISIRLLVAVISAIILSSLISAYGPQCPWVTAIKQIDVSFFMLFGTFLAAVFKLGEIDVVIKKNVPVQMLIVFTGMTMLMGVAKKAGIIDLLSGLVLNNIPSVLVASSLVLIAGFMSCFSSSLSVVFPMLFPIVPDIAMGASLSPDLLYSAIFIGATGAGISPFSSGGFLLLSNCPLKSEADRLWIRQLSFCGINIVAGAVYFLVLSVLD
jgi:di/tricarboxylate transporter